MFGRIISKHGKSLYPLRVWRSKLNKFFSSGKGSSLITSILMILIMSLLGITIITATFSNMQMSLLNRDVNKAYYVAEAGVEQIAAELDNKVAELQEEARAYVSSYIDSLLDVESPEYDEAYFNEDGSIKTDEVEKKFREAYLDPSDPKSFPWAVIEAYGPINAETYLDLDVCKSLLDTDSDEEGFAYKEISVGGRNGKAVLEEAKLKGIEGSGKYMLEVKVRGVFDEYSKRLKVGFDLLPDSLKTPYKLVSQIKVKHITVPDILKIPVVTKGNLISVGGTANIDGDVVCFGTIPEDPDNIGEEDMSASWGKYGGIIAGMSEEVHGNASHFGFDPGRIPNNTAGSVTVNGNAATLGYIHTIYGTGRKKSSDITVMGDTFARSVRAEYGSNYSVIKLGDSEESGVYISDNLQLDSSGSEAVVAGNYHGFIDAGYNATGTGSYAWQNKRTSSIVINGDSHLHLNGDEVYLGGTVFLSDYIGKGEYENGENDNNFGYMYMTGISAGKSGNRIGYAFRKNEEGIFTLGGNPDNILYWHSGDVLPQEIKLEDSDGDGIFPVYSLYNNGEIEGEGEQEGEIIDKKMLNGKSDEPGYFPMRYRGIHFKAVWDNLWNNDGIGSFLYQSYVNTGNITISKTVENGNKLIGYSNGAIAANGKVYGPFDVYKPGYDSEEGIKHMVDAEWHIIQEYCKNAYYNAVNVVVSNIEELFAAKSEKSIFEWIEDDKKSVLDGNLYTTDSGIFYYINGDVDITYNDLNDRWLINGNIMDRNRGIICAEGSIYVNSSDADMPFSFTGSMMATKNIVFVGDANIDCDESILTGVLTEDMLKGKFSVDEYMEYTGDTVKSQRISVRNIKVDEWCEIG